MSILNKEHILKPICLSILCLLVMVETDYIGLISRLPSNGQEGLVVGALVSRSSGLSQGHRDMLMSNTLNSHRVSLHPSAHPNDPGSSPGRGHCVVLIA